MSHMNMIECAINGAGGVTALASKLGIRSPTVSQWKSGARPVPPRFVIAIETASNGAVSRHDLRPDIFGPASSEVSGAA